MLVWCWETRPGRAAGAHTLVVEPQAVLRVRLGRFRTVIRTARFRSVELYHDEVDPESLARLRRELKHAVSLGRRHQHVETL